jgi:hypothetical protein
MHVMDAPTVPRSAIINKNQAVANCAIGDAIDDHVCGRTGRHSVGWRAAYGLSNSQDIAVSIKIQNIHANRTKRAVAGDGRIMIGLVPLAVIMLHPTSLLKAKGIPESGYPVFRRKTVTQLCTCALSVKLSVKALTE